MPFKEQKTDLTFEVPDYTLCLLEINRNTTKLKKKKVTKKHQILYKVKSRISKE